VADTSGITDLKDHYIQIYVEQFDALEMYIAPAASDPKTMKSIDITKVSNEKRNFTMAPSQSYFVTVNSSKGATQNQI